MSTSSGRRIAWPVLYALVFLAFFDTFALLPTVGPYAEALGASAFMVGVAVASYSVSNLVFNVVGGFAVDRFGRAGMLFAGLLVAAVAVAMYPLATSPTALVMLRLLHGAGGGLAMPALFTLIGDVAADGQRGRAMGRAGAFIGLAAVIGPMVAGMVRATFSITAVFVCIAVVLLVAALIAAAARTVTPVAGTAVSPALLQDPLSAPVSPTGHGEQPWVGSSPGGTYGASPASGRSARARGRTIVLATAAVFGFTAAFGTLAAFLPGHLDVLTSSVTASGLTFSAISSIAALLMLSPLARWVDIAGPRLPLCLGLAGFSAAMAILATSSSLPTTVLAAGLFGVAFGVVFPAATGAVAIAAGARRRGRMFGWFNAAYSLGFIVGPPIGGLAVAVELSAFAPVAVTCAVLAGLMAIGLGGEFRLLRRTRTA